MINIVLKCLDYYHIVAVFIVFSFLNNLNIENTFAQSCELKNILSILTCSDDNDSVETRLPDKLKDEFFNVPLILPFP